MSIHSRIISVIFIVGTDGCIIIAQAVKTRSSELGEVGKRDCGSWGVKTSWGSGSGGSPLKLVTLKKSFWYHSSDCSSTNTPINIV
jgi:hypothetical protein